MGSVSFPRQVLAVVFRRGPAFLPEADEPTTFPGRVIASWRMPKAAKNRLEVLRDPSELFDSPLPEATVTIRVHAGGEMKQFGKDCRQIAKTYQEGEGGVDRCESS